MRWKDYYKMVNTEETGVRMAKSTILAHSAGFQPPLLFSSLCYNLPSIENCKKELKSWFTLTSTTYYCYHYHYHCHHHNHHHIEKKIKSGTNFCEGLEILTWNSLLLRNCHHHNIPLNPIPTKFNLIHIFTTYSSKTILTLSFCHTLCWSCVLLSGFPTKLCIHYLFLQSMLHTLSISFPLI